MKFIVALFSHRLYIVVFIILTLYSLFFAPSGFNRIINWGFNGTLKTVMEMNFQLILILYFVCYGILALCKKKTNFILSILHITSLVISIILLNVKTHNPACAIAIVSILSFIFFTLNFTFSIIKNDL